MKEEMYRIGDIAEMFQLSVQTLRFYEKIGLFQPALIEESTGYRYYHWEQFERLRHILFLRSLGLSLKDIKHQLDVQHSTEYKSLLENYSTALEQRIRSDTLLKRYIDVKIESLELASYLPKNETLFMLYPSTTVLRHDCVKSSYTRKEMELMILELISKYRLKPGIDGVGQFFSLDALTDEKGSLLTAGLFVTEEVFTEETYTIAADRIMTLPKGVYAVMYYDTTTQLSFPYVQKLLEDIRRKSFRPCGDIIRTIVFDLGRRGNPAKDDYLACMRVLVQKT